MFQTTTGRAAIVMACIVMAYTVIAYTAMAFELRDMLQTTTGIGHNTIWAITI